MTTKPTRSDPPDRRHYGVSVLVALAALLLLPLVLIAASTMGDPVFISVLIVGTAVVLGIVSLFVFRVARSRKARSPSPVHAPPSADLRLVASRLISVEKRVAAISKPAEADGAVADIASDLGLLSGLVKGLADALGQQERELTDLRGRVDFLSRRVSQTTLPRLADLDVPPGAKPHLASFAPAHPALQHPPRLFPEFVSEPVLSAADDHARRDRILEAAHDHRVELRLEPIVSLPQRHRWGYGMLSRLRLADGSFSDPNEFTPMLATTSDLERIDESILSRAFAVAAELEPASRELRLACRLHASALHGDMIEAMAAQFPAGARRMTLDLDAKVWRSLSTETTLALSRLKVAGMLLSMSGLDQWSVDEALACPIQPDFVRVACHLIAQAAPDRAAASLRRLRERGIRIVAEHVESESEILDLLDYDVPYAQGRVFGAPRPLLAEGASAAAASSAPSIEPGQTDAPLRLRDIVRRVG